MREILFKAKRIDNGEWVEGYLIQTTSVVLKSLIVTSASYTFGKWNWADWVEVDTDTICQYTGLTDKNGNKIWENDVIKNSKIHALGKVEFMEDTFCLNDVYDGKQYINGMWNDFEIIGNIFDNPELLGV